MIPAREATKVGGSKSSAFDLERGKSRDQIKNEEE